MDVPSDPRRSPSRWDLIRSNHLRLTVDLAFARSSLEAVRFLTHSVDPGERGRAAYARAAEHYDKARHLLDQIQRELTIVERNRKWEPAPAIRTGPLTGDRRTGTDRRSGRDRRALVLPGVRFERRQGQRRQGQRREAPAM